MTLVICERGQSTLMGVCRHGAGSRPWEVLIQ